MSNANVLEILKEIEKMFPNAGCELNYQNIFQLIIAVSLSAQTTDKSVNLVTPVLFEKYPTCYELAKADVNDVKEIIKSIGLSNNKSKNIIELSKTLVDKYNGKVPNTQEDLESLPGVGRKTANVVLTEGFKIARLPVDTHVERVAKRLGLVEEKSSVLETEKVLTSLIDEEYWHKAHHLLLFFGRYHCFAKKPMCNNCFYQEKCKYYNNKL